MQEFVDPVPGHIRCDVKDSKVRLGHSLLGGQNREVE